MQIIVDTREQKKLDFKLPIVRECLSFGDYRARFDDGTLSSIVFERKSKNDLFGTLSQGYERFKKEIERSKEEKIKLVIITENNLRSILSGCVNSQRNGVSIVQQLFTLRIRYGIETVYSTSREEMSEYITHTFLSLEREHQDNKSRAGTC